MSDSRECQKARDRFRRFLQSLDACVPTCVGLFERDSDVEPFVEVDRAEALDCFLRKYPEYERCRDELSAVRAGVAKFVFKEESWGKAYDQRCGGSSQIGLGVELEERHGKPCDARGNVLTNNAPHHDVAPTTGTGRAVADVMRKKGEATFGGLCTIAAFIVYCVAGVCGFFMCVGIVVDHLGFIGGAIAFLLFPVTLAFAPWYEALANSNWLPFMVVYGGGIGAFILSSIGAAIDRG